MVLNENVLKKILLCFLVSVWGLNVVAQEQSTDSLQKEDAASGNAEVSLYKALSVSYKKTKKDGPKVRFSGFMRMVGFYRNLSDYYPDTYTLRGMTVPVTVNIGDGSGNPLLMMRMETNPTSKTSMLLETSMHSPFLSNAGCY